MPAGKKAAAASSDPKAAVKGYKPPWIKEAAEPNKETETPWGIMKKRDSIVDPEEAKRRVPKREDNEDEEESSFAIPTLRKVSLKTDKLDKLENGADEEKNFKRPALKSVKTKERAPVSRDESSSKIVIPKLNSVKVEKMKELPPPPKKDNPDYRQVLKKTPTKDKIDEEKKRGAPMAPPMPPPPPAMPRPIQTDPLNKKQKQKLDNLKSRPKTRPDWTALLKGIETGAKLKHVDCNDRSKPLLTGVKAKGQFLYESEKDNAHNVLLKEIQSGVKLKGVKTNDRSRPNLEGLRKFRRQMTIEEQIQKSLSMASMMAPISNCASVADVEELIKEGIIAPEMVANVDEMDDIDKVRDDLQSTKQLLAIELRNKETVGKENKRLLSQIKNLQKQLELENGIAISEQNPENKREPDEKLIITLKAEVAQARKKNEELDRRFTQTAIELTNTKFELDEMKRRNSELEKRLQEFLCKRVSIADRRDSQMPCDDDMDNNDDDDESEEEETEEKKAKRAIREVKMLSNKLRGFKNKEDNAKKERIALKELMKKHQKAIKEEKKKYKQLQKEVDKMAALMKESESDEEDEEEEDEDDEEEDESESSESETESSETESESEKSQSEPEDAPADKKKENLVARSRRHESRLAALKKTNIMLKTNMELLQDDLNKQKEQTQSLQHDLDSVLAELG